MPLASVADMELVMEAREVLKESAQRDLRTAKDMLRELLLTSSIIIRRPPRMNWLLLLYTRVLLPRETRTCTRQPVC